MFKLFRRKNNFTVCVDWKKRGDVAYVIAKYMCLESDEHYYKRDEKCYIGFITRLTLDEVLKELMINLDGYTEIVGNTIFVELFKDKA